MRSSPIDTFCTDRLTAERLRPEHLPEYVRLFEDARVMATLSPDGKPLRAEEAARWLQLSLEHWDRHDYGFWAIRTRPDNHFVGRAGLKNVQIDGESEVELAYALLPVFWGRGLATEIAGAILELAFENMGLTEIICYTLTTNVASQQVMKKVGFQFEREGVHAGLPHVFFRCTAAGFRANVASKIA